MPEIPVMIITAPWTDEQVRHLNEQQNDGRFHPYTCGGSRMDEAHMAYAKQNGGDHGQLVATKDGWICPVCGYRQKTFMARAI